MTTMTLPRYADRLGVRAPYLYRLKREGKLVLLGDEIDVEETDRKLADAIDWKLELARGPGKVARALMKLGVVKGAQRTEPDGSSGVAGGIGAASSSGVADPAWGGEGGRVDVGGYEPRGGEVGQLTQMRIRRETADAQFAELRYMQTVGLLVARSEVERELEPLFSTMRESLMAIPDRLAPLVAAETDEHAVHAMISSEVRAALNELADRAGAQARETGQRQDTALAAA